MPEPQNNSVTTINTNKYTTFEDLSNEIIYEIFEYLDIYQFYEKFSILKLRFRNLLTLSNLPIKINIFHLSKSSFQQFYEHFIKYHTHRIRSFYVFNAFIANTIFSSVKDVFAFTRLERLYLDKIELADCEQLLNDLALLPKLSSLSINLFSNFCNKNILYRQIFHLPTLKHCTLSFNDDKAHHLLPTAVNHFSPIEHLVINNEVYLDELPSLLSYVPHLRRLSLKSLVQSYRQRPNMFFIILNNLTYVSVELKHIQFDQFELLIINLFHHLRVLHISTSNDDEYLNAKRWERIISSHMSHLHIFDIQHRNFRIHNEVDGTTCKTLMDSFATPFWTTRKWFFTHEHNYLQRPNSGVFHSVQPYRRQYYVLDSSPGQYSIPCHTTDCLDSVCHLCIKSNAAVQNCSTYFPNATELTISTEVFMSHDFITNIANGHIPLVKLTKISIDNDQVCFVNIMKILYLTPNCNKLILNSLSLDEADLSSIQSRELLNGNNITDVTIKSLCGFEKVRLLINLFPGLKHLTISVFPEEFRSTLNYLLMNNENSFHLHSLEIGTMGNVWVEKLLNTITEVRQYKEVFVKIIGHCNCYLWW